MLSWIAKPLNKVSKEQNSSVPSCSRNRRRHILLLTITSLLLLPVGIAIFLAARLSIWSTFFLYSSWHRLPGKPALINQVFNNFLLTKIKLEKIVTDVSQLLWIRAAVKVSPKPLQDEETPSRQGHDSSGSVETLMQDESVTFATLSYYMVGEMRGTLAVVRYHARNEQGEALVVAEDRFEDTPDDFCRLQDDVEEALLNGYDVCVMSQHDPETFQKIHSFILEGGGQIDV